MTARRRERPTAAWPLVVALAAACLAAGPARVAGQMVVNHAALDPSRPNVVQVVTGLQYGLIAGIGYTRAVALGGRTLLVSASVASPWADADTRDYGGRVCAAIDILGWDRWRLLGGLGGTVQGTENALSRMTSLGADGVLIGGYWSPRWFIAAAERDGAGTPDGGIRLNPPPEVRWRLTDADEVILLATGE